nr:putative mfs-type transporter [Quercus suber]
MIGIASAAIYSVLGQIATETGLTLGDLNAGTGYVDALRSRSGLLTQQATVNGSQTKFCKGFLGLRLSRCHERGAYIGLYALLLAGSNFFAPIIAGFIEQGQGWQWVLYWCAIFCGIGFVFLFFFMEETNYRRQVIVGHDRRQPLPLPTAVPSGEKVQIDDDAEPIDMHSPVPYERKSYLDKLKFFRSADLHKPNQLLAMATRPLIFLTFPVIAYAGFSYGSSLVWFNVLNGTASLVLGGAPYNFPGWAVGLSYVSPLIGVFVGSFYTGWFGDRMVLHMARRNHGISEAEHRLWLFLPSLILIPFGLILWGVGAAHAIQWFGCVFAMGVIALTNTIGLQLSVSYCIDSYKDLSGEAVVTVILIRNTMSFAIGYGITPWVTNMGLQNAFVVAAFAGMAQCATFLLFVVYGKGMRRNSAARYAKYVEEMVDQ